MKSLLFILLISAVSSCSSDSNSQKREKSSEENSTHMDENDLPEIEEKKASFLNLTKAEYKMNVSEPSDGEMDDEIYGEGSEMIEKTIVDVIKGNKIFWCYDCCNLETITFYGAAENVDIYYNGDIVEKAVKFTKIYSLKANDFMGGELLIKDGNKTLYKIDIEYEGCY